MMTLNRISFEENVDRLKVVIPLERKWGYWLVYTLLLLIWVGATLWGIGALYDALVPLPYTGGPLAAFIIIILIIIYFWYRLWKMVWRSWQYYSANREILFFYPDKLVVRRPLSLLGVTDGYDWQHVAPFRYDEKINAPVFDYGSYRIPVGPTLQRPEAEALVGHLNGRFFPDFDADLDDEE